MHSERTDLLPSDRQRAIRRDYFLRLAAATSLLLAALAVAATLLLAPSYVFLEHSVATKQTHLAQLKATLAASDEAALSARLAALSAQAAVLSKIGGAQGAVARLADALSVSRAGIILSGLSYAPKPRTITLAGTAATRDALRQYQLALSAAPFFARAELPVSAYAKDADIPFVITITLAP